VIGFRADLSLATHDKSKLGHVLDTRHGANHPLGPVPLARAYACILPLAGWSGDPSQTGPPASPAQRPGRCSTNGASSGAARYATPPRTFPAACGQTAAAAADRR
jgi:hypothetical protein